MDSTLSELSRIHQLKGEFLELQKKVASQSQMLEQQEKEYSDLFDDLMEAEDQLEKIEVQNQTIKEDRDLMFWVGIATVSAVLFAPDVANLIRMLFR
ncbi:hypothetical protein IQ255_20185 [Pleurocapsales cyanobacterium LEGE 10410]|nr:hypothetical protein [Pleurocapsales cyanobacterium LEGE 10410]